MWRLLLVFPMLAIACTGRNPRVCPDGMCVDPSYPFCDSDGSLGGEPNVCVAVDCNPGEFVECRGDEAIICNGLGTNYEVRSCPLGCDAVTQSCRTCTTNDQCNNPTPVCNTAENTCRGCISDDECSSSVCDTDVGSCVPEEKIVYATATGGASTPCSLAMPCTLTSALDAALSQTSTPTLRLLPGTYSSSIDVASPTALPLTVVGTGATLIGLLQAKNGANVRVRNLDFKKVDASGRVFCGDPSVPSVLSIRDATIQSASGDFAIQTASCNLSLYNVTVNALYLSIGSDSSFDGDRLHIQSASAFGSTNTQRVRFTVRDSILENVPPDYTESESPPAPNSSFTYAYNTFVDDIGDFYLCPTKTYRPDVRFENNVMLTTASGVNVFAADPVCARNNVLSRQSPVPADNIVADPQFVDMARGDYHVKPTSPAVNAASPSIDADTDHDFTGAPRPQGPKSDIGAYEQ